MIIITEEYLISQGYTKTNDCTYSKIDEESKMTIELEFNPSGSSSQNKEIENNIVNIMTRLN